MLYRTVLRPLLFALPPSAAHSLALAALAPWERWPWTHTPHDPRLASSLCGLTFPSPIGLAAGLDKNARRPRSLAALGFGFLELGTVTYLPQEENPAPNLFRLPRDHALINRLGFPNEGAQIVADRLRTLRDQHPLSIPIGLSIGKSRHVPVADTAQVTEDTLACFRAVRTAADFVVVNVSSPNTPGLRSLQAPACAQPLLSALVEENLRGKPLPLFLKLAPDLHSYALDALLTVLSQLPLAGVVATNTTVARRGLITPPAVVKALGEGGLSGPPLRPRALEVVAHTRKRLGPKAIILGVGGIETPADAEAFLIAGADLVQVYTGFVYEGPGLPRTLAKGLIERMEYHHAKDFAHYLEILRAASPG